MPISTTDVLYTGVVTADNGREGRVADDDGRLDLMVSQPEEVGGSGQGTNPEQLFAAAYSACFHASIAIVAGADRVDVTGSSVTARIGLGRDGGGFGIVADLTAHLPGVDPATARRLVDKAHQLCPYSRMTREGITVSVAVADLSAR